jgi:hypothetical protein
MLVKNGSGCSDLQYERQFFCTHGTIESDTKQRKMRNRIKKASSVCPERVRPLASVIVNESITGNDLFLSSQKAVKSTKCSLCIQGVENRFKQQQVRSRIKKAPACS